MKLTIIIVGLVFVARATGYARSWLLWAMVAALFVFALEGCAALPMPLQPQSHVAEGTWLVLDTVDTMQTVQIAKHHECYREIDPIAEWIYGSKYPKASRVILTNVALASVHMMVTSWLDDKAAEGSVSWYRVRIAWHAGSILYSGASVAHNMQQGLGLTTTRSCPK